MTAPAKSFTVVADTSIDADSPLDVTLITALRDNDQHLEEWLGKDYAAAVNHDHDDINSKKISMANVSKTGAVEVFDHFALSTLVGWQTHNAYTMPATGYGENGFVLLGPATADALRHGISNLANKPFKISGGNTLTFEARVKLSGVVAAVYYFGLMDADDLTGNGIIFGGGAAGGPIEAKCMSGGTLSYVNTNVNWTANTTYKFKIVATASQVLFYVDDVLKATITTNIPTAAMGVCLFIRGTVTACAVDYVQCTT